MRSALLTAILFICLLSLSVYAQPDILWTQTFGDEQFNQARDLEFDDQGNIYLCGTWNWTPQDEPLPELIDGDMWFLKLSPDGDLLAEATFGVPMGDMGHAIAPAHGGGFVLGGTTYHEGTDASADGHVVCVTDEGDLVWEVWVGSDVEESVRDIIPTNDGGYLAVGWTRSSGFGLDDAWLFKLDGDGNLLWEQMYGGSLPDQLWSAIPLENGHFVLGGRTLSHGAQNRDAYMMEVDENGDLVWLETIGGPGRDHFYEIALAPDGGLIGAGKTESYDVDRGDSWLVKMDSQANVEWITIWGNERGEWARSCTVTTDGNYVYCGETGHPNLPGNQVLVNKVSSDGEILWTSEVGGDGMDDTWCVRQAPNGDYVVVGFTQSYGDADQSVYVLRYGVEYDPLELDQTLLGLPYVLPGERFSRRWTLRNNQQVPVENLDLWQQLLTPDGLEPDSMLLEDAISLDPQITMSADSEILTEDDWEYGEYRLDLFIGDYPNAYDSDSIWFTMSASGARMSDPDARRPDEFTINRIYPNPFNSTTTISLALPSPTRVDVRLFDIAGRIVGKVYSGTANAGEFTVPVRMAGYASGVYLLNVSTGQGDVDTKRITLVR